MLNLRTLRRDAGRTSGPSEEDLRVLVDLAARQVRYGQPEEAVILLRLHQQFRPDDPRAMMVAATAFLAMGEWDATEAMLAAHKRTGGPVSAGAHLLAALAARARRHVDAAARAFSDYLAVLRGDLAR